MIGLPPFFGFGIVLTIIGPKFLGLGIFFINSKARSKSSSFYSSCCNSWNPLGNEKNYLKGLTLLKTNSRDNSGFVTVSNIPWKTMTG